MIIILAFPMMAQANPNANENSQRNNGDNGNSNESDSRDFVNENSNYMVYVSDEEELSYDPTVPNDMQVEWEDWIAYYGNQENMQGTEFITASSVIPSVSYSAHVQDRGWLAFVSNGQTAGTTGSGLRMEAMRVSLGSAPAGSGIRYRSLVQSSGWQAWQSNGNISGTTGRSLRLEAVQIELTGAIANTHHIEYRVHVQNTGWLSWVRDGATAGSGTLRIEAIQIRLVLRPMAQIRPFPNWGENHMLPTFNRARGVAIGTLPNPPSRGTVASNPRFIDWFTGATSGQRVRSNTIVPNVTQWNLHARWTDPSRNHVRWWRPADSGETMLIVRDFEYNATWQNAMVQGINNWNRSTARVHINRFPFAGSTISVHPRNQSNPSSLGRLYPTVSGTNLTGFRIELYSDTIAAHVNRYRNLNPNNYAESAISTNITVARVVESVMTHELGHAIGLIDNPAGAPNRNDSIMNYGRRRWVRRAPSNFDIISVNIIY